MNNKESNLSSRESAGNQERVQEGVNATSPLPQLQLPPSITVRQLADALKVEPVKVIKQLMRKGIMASINQSIDFDTAAMVAANCAY